MVLAIAIPPGESPDEAAHVARADSVTHGALFGERRPVVDPQGAPSVSVLARADENLERVTLFFPPGTPLAEKHVTAGHLQEEIRTRWQLHTGEIAMPNTGAYPPTFYLPAALALRLARAVGIGPFFGLIAARLAQAAAYAALGAAALSLGRHGRPALLCLLCLPMSLWLAATLNPDGLIVATCALAAALLTRRTRRCWWAAAALLGLAAMSKPFLAPLAIALPAAHPALRPREALAGLLLAALPAALWAAAMALFVAVPFTHPLGSQGAATIATNPPGQLRFLLAWPPRLLSIPLASLLADWPALWRGFIGTLGMLDMLLPPPLYRLWIATLLLATLVSLLPERPGSRPSPALPAAPLLALVAATCAAFLTLYVVWTPPGAPLVAGMQGRYFIPIAAFTLPLLTLPGTRPAPLAHALSTPLIALAAFSNIAVLPALLLLAYYVH